MDRAIGSLENSLSKEAFNSSDVMKFGEWDCCILSILWLQRPSKGGESLVPLITQGGAALVPLIPIGAGVEVPLILVPLIPLGYGVKVPLSPL